MALTVTVIGVITSRSWWLGTKIQRKYATYICTKRGITPSILSADYESGYFLAHVTLQP